MKYNTLFLACMLVSAVAVAQVGVVDVERVFQESELSIRLSGEYMEALNQVRGEIGEKESALIVLQRENEMDPSEEMQKRIQDRRIVLERFREDAMRKVEEDRKERMKAVDEVLQATITELGSELKLYLVIPASMGYYYSENVDITDKVIARMNLSE